MTTTLIIIGSIIAVILLMALLIGNKVNLERTVIINKPKQQVFDYVRHVKNHDNFSVWHMMDPDMKKEYNGTDGQVGFVYAWDSSKQKNVGAGEQEIKNITSDTIEFELRFKRPMEDTAHAKMVIIDAEGNKTKLTWGFYSTMKFPMNLMKPLMMGMLGKSLDSGLQNLKNVMEK
ncbi:MAG: hypothetical protein K0S32_3219 [Bacteroidetes bacterium]|jgi:hypothetical protein|nr:hypothetical protein [Bacteroidota bacterium]